MSKHEDLVEPFAIHPAAFVGSSDPGAVGPHKLWIDTTTGPPYTLKKRDAGDTAWEGVGDSPGSAAISTLTDVDLTGLTDGDILYWDAGGSKWVVNAPPTGFVDPMTTNGDIIIRASGVPARLAIGTTGYVLTVVAGLPAWQAAFVNPMTTNGDLITRAAGVPARIPAGSNGKVLTMVSGAPDWATPAGGGGSLGIWTPDKIPSSPGSLDDEFNNGSFTGWTDLDSLLSVTEDADHGDAMVSATGVSARYQRFVKSIPTPTNDWVAVLKLHVETTADNCWGGIVIRDSSDGKSYFFGLGLQVSNNRPALILMDFADTAFHASRQAPFTNSSDSSSMQTIQPPEVAGPFWLRVTRVNSGPYLIIDYSSNGKTWRNFAYINPETDYLINKPDQIGFLFYSSAFADHKVYYDYFRFFDAVTSARIGGMI